MGRWPPSVRTRARAAYAFLTACPLRSPERSQSGAFLLAKDQLYFVAVSEEAYHYAQRFSRATGLPVNQVASDALLHLWDAYGESAVKKEEEIASRLPN